MHPVGDGSSRRGSRPILDEYRDLRSVWWLDLATAMHEGNAVACLDYARQAREYILKNRGRWRLGWQAQLMRRAKVAIALAEQAAKAIRGD